MKLGRASFYYLKDFTLHLEYENEQIRCRLGIYRLTCCSSWVWGLVCRMEERSEIWDIWEQGAKWNIWNFHGLETSYV